MPRAWVRGEVKMMEARAAGGHAMGAARELRGAPRHAAYAAGQAGAVAHVAAHDLGAAAYAIRAARAAVPQREAEAAGRRDANGSVTNSRTLFVNSYLTISGCGTTSAWSDCLTAGATSPAADTSLLGATTRSDRSCRTPAVSVAAASVGGRCVSTQPTVKMRPQPLIVSTSHDSVREFGHACPLALASGRRPSSRCARQHARP